MFLSAIPQEGKKKSHRHIHGCARPFVVREEIHPLPRLPACAHGCSHPLPPLNGRELVGRVLAKLVGSPGSSPVEEHASCRV